MVGHDADTYGAAAGPLIIAAHKVLPSGFDRWPEGSRDIE